MLSLLTTPVGTRFHWFELHELAACPNWLRNLVTDVLHFGWTHSVLGLPPVLSALASVHVGPLVRRHRISALVDLCSGGGGPVPALLHALQTQESAPPLKAVLTDLFPNLPAFERARAAAPPGSLSYVSSPVDATACSIESIAGGNGHRRCRTMFLSMHHMRPDLATLILADAVAKQDAIAIFELQSRAPINLLAVAVFLLLPVIALFKLPFSWRRLVFTLFIPLVPFIVAFDGIVSSLRTYSDPEMRTLIRAADPESKFDWCIETRPAVSAWFPFLPLISYVGVPRVWSECER